MIYKPNQHKVNLSKPYVEEQAINDVVSVIKSGWLTQGKKVATFENTVKDILGTPHALAVNSATSGLHMALLALGVGNGDEIIVPAFTWVATANVVELCGATPVFVDIDLDTFNANLDQIHHKITPNTKAIIMVHLFGKPFDVCQLKSTLGRNIPIIEDAACALGASINKQLCGTMGTIGVFSFHPRKSITTGEGGMVVTNDATLYKHMNMLRNHGQDCSQTDGNPWSMFDCPMVGFNFRMTDFQAALGTPQLLQLNKIIDDRKALVALYREKLSGCDAIVLPTENANERHTWQSYVVQVPAAIRNAVMSQLAAVGIETRPGTHAVHMLSYYKNKYRFSPQDFAGAHQAFMSTISLPLHNHMNMHDVEYVSSNLLKAIHDAQ